MKRPIAPPRRADSQTLPPHEEDIQSCAVIAVSLIVKMIGGLLLSLGHLVGLEVVVGDSLAAPASPSGQVPFGAQDNGRRFQW
jgi:hypothetical protein